MIFIIRRIDMGEYKGLRTPRSLSVNERRMVDKSIVSIDSILTGDSNALPVRQAALNAIICSEHAWPSLAASLAHAVHDGVPGAKARMVGTIIGMTHVLEVRHDYHDGRVIASMIDRMTRDPDYDALLGYITERTAFSVIMAVFGSARHAGA